MPIVWLRQLIVQTNFINVCRGLSIAKLKNTCNMIRLNERKDCKEDFRV